MPETSVTWWRIIENVRRSFTHGRFDSLERSPTQPWTPEADKFSVKSPQFLWALEFIYLPTRITIERFWPHDYKISLHLIGKKEVSSYTWTQNNPHCHDGHFVAPSAMTDTLTFVTSYNQGNVVRLTLRPKPPKSIKVISTDEPKSSKMEPFPIFMKFHT